MANFGIGLGAFADGFNRGWGLGDKISQSIEKGRMRRAFKDARSAYDSAVADDVLTQVGQQSASGQQVDIEGAKKKAQGRIGSFTDFVYQHQLPNIIDTAVANGDLASAEMLQKWGDDKNERKKTERFGKTLQAFAAGQATGDYNDFAKQAMGMLNNGGYGLTATGFEIVKDDAGNQTGLTFNIKDSDGNESKRTFGMEEAGYFIAEQGDPRTMANRYWERQAGADKFKAEMAKERGKAQIGLSKDVALEDHKHANRLQLEAAKTKNKGSDAQRNYEETRSILEAEGFTEDEIKPLIPAMLKLTSNEYRKGRSPEEFRQTLMMELMKDYNWSRKSPEEIEARIDQLMKIAIRQQKRSAAPAAQPGITGGVPVLQ